MYVKCTLNYTCTVYIIYLHLLIAQDKITVPVPVCTWMEGWGEEGGYLILCFFSIIYNYYWASML